MTGDGVVSEGRRTAWGEETGFDQSLEAVANDENQTFTRQIEIVDSIGDLLVAQNGSCLLYTSPSPRDKRQSRMPSSA